MIQGHIFSKVMAVDAMVSGREARMAQRMTRENPSPKLVQG